MPSVLPFAGFGAMEAALAEPAAAELPQAAAATPIPRPAGEFGGAPSETGSQVSAFAHLARMTDLQFLPHTYGELQACALVPGCFRVFAGKSACARPRRWVTFLPFLRRTCSQR